LRLARRRWSLRAGSKDRSGPECMLPVNTSAVAAAVMKQQTAIAIPEEWILLLSGVLRRDTRLGIDLHVAGRLVERRVTRICGGGRWRGRDGACVGECGEAQGGTADDASGSDGGRNEADDVTRHGCVHFEFSFASGCLVLSALVSITDLCA